MTTDIRPRPDFWRPSARQREVYDLIAEAPEGSRTVIGYGGAAGGGKTVTLAELAIDISLACPGARTLVGRKEFVDLQTTTLEQFDKLIHPRLLAKKYDSHPIYRDVRDPSWPEGVVSRVYFRGVKAARDSIGSEEYGWILLEEAHEIAEGDALYLFSRLRHRPERKWGMVVGFNPFPGWPVRWFIDRVLPEELLGGIGAIHFVPSRMRDNPGLDDGYEKFLRATYPKGLAQALIDGLPGYVENAIYDMLDRVRHFAKVLPADTRWVDGAIGFDYGEVHPNAIVAVTRSAGGRYWVRETVVTHDLEKAIAAVARMKVEYRIRKVRVDNMLKGWDKTETSPIGGRVERAAPDRKWRIGLCTRLFNGDALYLDPKGEGNAELWRQLLAYHKEFIETDTKETWDVVRKDEDAVGALEDAIEELEGQNRVTPPTQARRVLSKTPAQTYLMRQRA